MKTLIVGKIISNSNVVSDYKKAESAILAQGNNPINPFRSAVTNDFIEALILHLANLTDCDSIYLLSDWIVCPCARMVNHAAAEMRKKVIHQSDTSNSLNRMIMSVIGAVENSSGFAFSEIIKPGKQRKYYYTRLILVEYFENRCGLTEEVIFRMIGREQSTVKYCKKKFPHELKYNSEFRTLYEKSENYLSKHVLE